MPTGENTGEEAAISGGLYHLLWRWHFYAGLLVAPFILVLSITGLVYLFDNDLDAVVHRNVAVVTPAGTPQPLSSQEAAALAAYPGAQLSQYLAPLAPDRSAAWKLNTAVGQTLTVFVDPYTAQVTGQIAEGQRLGEIMIKLHGELLAGQAGDYVVELAACWAFVLLVTGLFLWWPRRNRRAGVLVPRLSGTGRSFWRDLHAVPAAWNVPIVAFLILTGLPWSSFWGGTLANFGTTTALADTMAPTPNFHAPPRASDPHAVHRAQESQRDDPHLPWTIRNSAYPAVLPASTTINIDEVAAEGLARSVFRISYPTKPGEVFTLSHVPDQAEGQRTVYLDPASGAVVGDIAGKDYSPVGKTVEFGVQTHMGRQFGLANKLVMAASCVVLAASVILGLTMWWKRRPGARLKAPAPGQGFRTPGIVIGIAIVLGVVFPLVGLSMLLILAVEALGGRLLRRQS